MQALLHKCCCLSHPDLPLRAASMQDTHETQVLAPSYSASLPHVSLFASSPHFWHCCSADGAAEHWYAQLHWQTPGMVPSCCCSLRIGWQGTADSPGHKQSGRLRETHRETAKFPSSLWCLAGDESPFFPLSQHWVHTHTCMQCTWAALKPFGHVIHALTSYKHQNSLLPPVEPLQAVPKPNTILALVLLLQQQLQDTLCTARKTFY